MAVDMAARPYRATGAKGTGLTRRLRHGTLAQRRWQNRRLGSRGPGLPVRLEPLDRAQPNIMQPCHVGLRMEVTPCQSISARAVLTQPTGDGRPPAVPAAPRAAPALPAGSGPSHRG